MVPYSSDKIVRVSPSETLSHTLASRNLLTRKVQRSLHSWVVRLKSVWWDAAQ